MDEEYIANQNIDVEDCYFIHPPPKHRYELRCTSRERMEKLLEIEKAAKWLKAWTESSDMWFDRFCESYCAEKESKFSAWSDIRKDLALKRLMRLVE